MKKFLLTAAVLLTLGASVVLAESYQEDSAFDSQPRAYTIINLPF
ncbi:hypothetical protein SFC02_12005 [Terribacillus goriensis]|nr:hypothetical protein [Virgibacillus sp. 7505]